MVDLYVLALLYSESKILLLRRCNATFGNGLYSLVGGKVESGEHALHAIKREVFEEVGLNISESDFSLVHTFHRKGTDKPLVALIFKAHISTMPVPRNMEPDKHDDLRFFNIAELPHNIIPAHKQAIECISQNIYYSEHGW
jgi:ADP-ribose pyrophosphatase YjhB (NUDIX family)